MKLISRIAFATALMSLIGALEPAGSSETSKGLRPADVFQMEYAADPQISPDGRRVVYVRQFADIVTDKRYSNLWIVGFDGSGHRSLTSGKFSDTSPRWSPDGSRVLYVSNRDGSSQIYVRWMDTGDTTQLTRLTESPSGIAWAPDGKQISFAALVPAPAPSIADLPSPPEGAKWAEPARVMDKLVYRFDQAGFLKRGYVHLFVIPSDGGTPRQVSSGDYQHGGPGFRSGEAVWAPDGKSLLISANRRPDYELEPLDTEIHEFSVEDGKVRTLTSRRGPDGSPAVSPDGKQIAYLGFDDRYQGHQNTVLYVMNRDGSGSRPLSKALDRSISNPQWSADSRGIYCLYDERGNTKLALFALDGSHKILAGDVGGGGSAYSGGSFSISRNGEYAVTYSRPEVPADVAVGRTAGSGLQVITSVNQDLLDSRKLGSTEEIWYESSKDKRRIHGWILKPPAFDPGRKYPLILEIHGGPFANYGDRFDLEKQIWAAGGYVVLYTNPRGSTSYGEEFANLIHHAYPGDDFHDLDSGVDAILAKGYIDSDNLFVTGGSGGGVLTCWMIGRTDRFRAAVTVYPVINWYSWVLSADISAFGVKYWFPGYPWDEAENYLERSLLSVVKNVKTPTMVLTGEEDYRTPMSESEQYYQALRLLGIESVLVRVPGEPHGIRRTPSHHVQKIAYIQGWFDRHKK